MNKLRAVLASTLLVALVAPAAFAIETHQEYPLTWNDPEFLNTVEECEEDVAKYNVQPGEVLWHFVQTDPAKDSGNLFINVEIGPIASVDSPAAVLHWYVVTPASFTTITKLESDVDGGKLVLSHTWYVEQEILVTPTPSQDVEGETGTPVTTAKITLPPSDSMGGTSGPSNGAWTILLVALAGLMASALVLTPAARKTRR
jgi:hypothetical protein